MENQLLIGQAFPSAAERIGADQAAIQTAAMGDAFQEQRLRNRLLAMDYADRQKAMEGNKVLANWLMTGQPNAAAQAPVQPAANQLGQAMGMPNLMPGENVAQAPQNALLGPRVQGAPAPPPEERTVQGFLAQVPENIKQQYPEQALAWANGQMAYYDNLDKQKETMFKDYIGPYAKSALETGNNDLLQATIEAGLKSGIPNVERMAQTLKDSQFTITGKAETKSQPIMTPQVREALLAKVTDPLVRETVNGMKDGERVEVVEKMGKISEVKTIKDVEAGSKTPYQQARDLVAEELKKKGLKRAPTEKEIADKQMQLLGQKTKITVDIRGAEHDRQQRQRATNNSYALSDAESNALDSAIADGRLNADRVNSRSAKIMAQLFLRNGNLDMNNSAATSKAQKDVQTQWAKLQPFEIKANRMFDRVLDAYNKNPQGTIYALNKLKTDFNTKFTGDPATVVLGRQIRTAMIEYAKVVNGSTGGAAVTDSARAEVETLLTQSDRPEAFRGSIRNERLAMKDAMAGYRETVDLLQAGGRGGNVRAPAAPGGPPPKAKGAFKIPIGAQTGTYKGQRAFTTDGKNFFSEADGRRIR